MKREIIDASQLELTEQVVEIKRVTKVVKGGRNMRFTALVVVGDKNGHVGAGLGKAAEIPEAIRKGKEDAMKKLLQLSLMTTTVLHMTFRVSTQVLLSFLRRLQKVLVSSLVVQHVPYVSLQVSEISVQSHLDHQISRTLFLLLSKDLSFLSHLRK